MSARKNSSSSEKLLDSGVAALLLLPEGSVAAEAAAVAVAAAVCELLAEAVTVALAAALEGTEARRATGRADGCAAALCGRVPVLPVQSALCALGAVRVTGAGGATGLFTGELSAELELCAPWSPSAPAAALAFRLRD